jgi:hypothetical protein
MTVCLKREASHPAENPLCSPCAVNGKAEKSQNVPKTAMQCIARLSFTRTIGGSYFTVMFSWTQISSGTEP